jgi:hypothetical protein
MTIFDPRSNAARSVTRIGRFKAGGSVSPTYPQPASHIAGITNQIPWRSLTVQLIPE